MSRSRCGASGSCRDLGSGTPSPASARNTVPPSAEKASELKNGEASSCERITSTAPPFEILTSDDKPVECSTTAYSVSPAGAQLRPLTAPSSRTIVGELEAVRATVGSPGMKYASREPPGAHRGSAAGG